MAVRLSPHYRPGGSAGRTHRPQNEKPGHPYGCPALFKPELRLVVSTSSCKTAIAAAMRND
jgi:hypothetical protein